MNLNRIKEYCIQNNIPAISPQTQLVIEEILHKSKPKTCLEIGSAVWYSTAVISQHIQKRWWFLYSFEISYPSYIQAVNNNKNLHNNIIYPFNFNNVNINKLLPERFDFVFVDAQKALYLDYLLKLGKKIQNSTIVFDDVIKFKDRIQPLYEYFEKNQINYQTIKTEDGDGLILIENWEM